MFRADCRRNVRSADTQSLPKSTKSWPNVGQTHDGSHSHSLGDDSAWPLYLLPEEVRLAAELAQCLHEQASAQQSTIAMTWIEISGYLASSLVLLTFCMRTMLSLRAIAICSNVGFIIYGVGASIHPVLVLHLILLPLNVAHLVRMLTVLRRAKSAANTDLSPNWLQPFMRKQHVNAGETIFKKGDHADALYLIESGEIELPEIKKILGPGDVFGEVGLFAIDRRRTQTAWAISDLNLFWITAEDLKCLCERNPGLSLYFLRLVATRLAANTIQDVSNNLSQSCGVERVRGLLIDKRAKFG